MTRSSHPFSRLGLAAVVVGLLPVCAACDLGELGRERLLVWHDWPEPEAAVLTELLTSYEDLDPELDLIVEYVPADEIEERFADEVRSGFGPDVVIGVDAAHIADLAADDALHEINAGDLAELGFDELDERSVRAMSIGESQLGVPLTGFTEVLYHRVDVEPPTSLDEIVELAEDGYTTAIPVEFFAAHWGVDAFDGTMFRADGTLAPDEGFVEWMEWLVEARPHPNIILDAEYETLRDLFASGKIDVFIGGSRDLGTFRTVLRDDETAASGSDDGSDDDQDGAENADADDASRSDDLERDEPGGDAADGDEAGGDGPERDDPDRDEDESDLPDDEPDEPEDDGGGDGRVQVSAPTLVNVDDLSFGLTTLPAGVDETPGGFLDVEGMVVNAHTTSFEGSLELMEYLTNAPSQGRIARSGVGRIPLNESVSIDPTISPMESALVAQQRRATVLPSLFSHVRAELGSVADDVYLQVARGVIEPDTAADALSEGFEEVMEERDG